MSKIDLRDELGIEFDNLYDLECYFQKHYEEFTKEQLMRVISEIVIYSYGD